MEVFNPNNYNILESCSMVSPPRQDSSDLDFKSLNVYNNALNHPKKISISKDELEQHNHQQKTKTVLNNPKDDAPNSDIKNTNNRINSILHSYTDGYLIDKIFNNLMENFERANKYINQMVDKFWFFRIRSLNVYFDIDIQDFDEETIQLIEAYTSDCITNQQIYFKLNGTITEVIARITKQAEPKIISKRFNEDIAWLQSSLYETREVTSFKWRFVL
jgi:hypothetical protein